MAKTNIKGRDVALFFEKPAGSGTYVRIQCATSVSLDLTTDETEVSCVESGNFKEFEPGDNSWSGSLEGGIRQITNDATGPGSTDATDNISSENLIDLQLAGAIMKIRFTLGLGAGSVRYEGKAFFTSNGIKGDRASAGALSTSFRGTGPLTKTLAPA
jgi:hypothetical protein